MAQQGHKEDLKAGLKGEYYNGTNFEQKVLTRIDPQLNFNWRGSSPARGVNQSYYSVRWTGKLVAPVSGRYTFNAMVDDGIRIWVGNRKVMDVWQLNDSKTFTGSIVLEGGHVYDLRIDYFNDMLEGEIKLYWVRPDAKKSFFSRFGDDPGEPITARYYKQPAPPVSAAPKPAPIPPAVASVTPAKPVSKPPVVASIMPKPAVSKRPAASLPEPVAKPVASVVPAKEPVRSLRCGTSGYRHPRLSTSRLYCSMCSLSRAATSCCPNQCLNWINWYKRYEPTHSGESNCWDIPTMWVMRA